MKMENEKSSEFEFDNGLKELWLGRLPWLSKAFEDLASNGGRQERVDADLSEIHFWMFGERLESDDGKR